MSNAVLSMFEVTADRRGHRCPDGDRQAVLPGQPVPIPVEEMDLPAAETRKADRRASDPADPPLTQPVERARTNRGNQSRPSRARNPQPPVHTRRRVADRHQLTVPNDHGVHASSRQGQRWSLPTHGSPRSTRREPARRGRGDDSGLGGNQLNLRSDASGSGKGRTGGPPASEGTRQAAGQGPRRRPPPATGPRAPRAARRAPPARTEEPPHPGSPRRAPPARRGSPRRKAPSG